MALLTPSGARQKKKNKKTAKLVINHHSSTYDCVCAGRRVILHTRYLRFIVPQCVISTFRPSHTHTHNMNSSTAEAPLYSIYYVRQMHNLLMSFVLTTWLKPTINSGILGLTFSCMSTYSHTHLCSTSRAGIFEVADDHRMSCIVFG